MSVFKKIIIVISIFGFMFPCDCAPPPSPEDAYSSADVVFSGQVTNIIEDWNNLLKEVSIDVYDVWKGTIQNQVIILTGIDDGICGYNFEVNEEYLIYGNYSGDFIWTNICTRTNLLENAEEDLDYLNSLNNTQCDDGYTEYENECYYNDDLNTLTMLIYLNDIEFEVFYDIGITLWENGHINTLILEGLLIHEIPNNIQNLDSLVHLSFSDNQLENIPVELGNLPSLEFLFLSNNQLYELPEQIGNLNNLKFLHLPGNQLTELPASISNLSNLQSLNVDNNLIISMPPNIIYLNSLQYLYIANNEIYQLPTDIGLLSELEILSAYTNNISVFPESIGNLFDLYHCDLTNNELIALPETICNIYGNLTVFNVGLNYICPPYPSCLDVDALGPQDISSCNEDFILGDINGDELLDILDIVLMINMILSNEYSVVADVNEDGSIDVLDVILMVNILVGGLPQSN